MIYDKDINIALGRSRKETNWINKTIKYSQFIEIIKQTNYTKETYKKYINFPKDIQDNIKDVGGFVGGTLKNNKRRKDTIIDRSLITLDCDYGYENMIEDLEKLLDFNFFIYTTHKHTKEKPRFRLVIPLLKNIESQKYEDVSKYIADRIGMKYFDKTTYCPSRLMYFPSTSIDGEYVFKLNDKPFLDPDTITINNLEDLKDNICNIKDINKKESPKLKLGIIGAFCRVYNVHDAIEKFLDDIYIKEDENRYTYTKGTTAKGVVVYNNGDFVYSHHSSDKCSERLYNSFDLVRIHKFSYLDEKIDSDTPINKLPSFSKMIEFINQDKAVMLELGKHKLNLAKEDFKDLYEFENNNNELKVDNALWVTKLEVDKNGKYKSTIKNINTILENDTNLKGKIAFNLFANRTMAIDNLPWRNIIDKDNGDPWQDSDDANLRMYFDGIYGIVSPYKIYDGVSIIEKKNEYHPIRNYLSSLTWDGENRVENLMIDYLGAKDCDYTKTTTRKMLVAAVNRIFNPGVKFDYMLVLVGKQGIGKSYLISLLGKSWYSDSINTVQGKEAYEQLQNAWILEMAELSATKKAEAEAVKHFISKTEDSYRQAYGRRVETYKRQCVFFGTTNEMEFLKDKTGNRRFWPLVVGVNPNRKNLFKNLNEYEINQIWAEAIMFYKRGEKLILEGNVKKEAISKQEQHLESNSKEGMIIEFLNMKLPTNWYSMDIYARRRYIQEYEFLIDKEGMIREKVCSAEIWVELLGGDIKMFYGNHTREINEILRNANGWQAYKDGAGKLRFGKYYGTQRAFIRI